VEDFCGLGTLQRIREYEHIFTRYWQAQASIRLIAAPNENAVPEPPALDRWRRRMIAARQRLLASEPGPDEVTLAELRRPTGDTVRLHTAPLRFT
jgi:hypothetical protein